MTNNNDAMADRWKILLAFRQLRKEGWFARMKFWCCQSCAWADVPEKYENGNVMFYHAQDAAAFDSYGNIRKGQTLFLAHQGNTKRAVEVLKSQGLNVVWDGSENTRVGVLPSAYQQ